MKFEERYQALYRDAAPSAELKAETLALMEEQQAHLHLLPKPKKASKKPLVLLLSVGGSIAAMLLVCVLLVFWLRQGNVYTDLEGSLPEDAFTTGTNTNEEEQPEGEGSGSSAGSATPDPLRQPQIIDTADTATYPSIEAFLTALADKSALGYGNYYLARELVIAPKALPEGARFLQLHLQKDGRYTYAYLFSANNVDYRLELAATVPPAKTLRDLKLRLEAMEGEQVSMEKNANARTYRFGSYDAVTVTVLPIEGEPPTTEQVDLLLRQFELERCSLENELIAMKY